MCPDFGVQLLAVNQEFQFEFRCRGRFSRQCFPKCLPSRNRRRLSCVQRCNPRLNRRACCPFPLSSEFSRKLKAFGSWRW